MEDSSHAGFRFFGRKTDHRRRYVIVSTGNWSDFPAKVLDSLRKMAEETSKDKMAREVHDDFKKFKDQVGIWGSISEQSYFDVIAKKYAI